MTYQYYALRALTFINKQKLKTEWLELMALPEEKQILEKGAVILAQWCQPMLNIEWCDIASQLDEIAEEVKIDLYHKHPKHSLFTKTQKELIKWREENIYSNVYNVVECHQLHKSISFVIGEKLGIVGNDEDYYTLENSFINKVFLI